MNLIYTVAQGIASCTTGSVYNGLNVGIAWVDFLGSATGGFYWQVDLARSVGCNYIRCMQDGGGACWQLNYNSGGTYLSNRATAFQRSVDLANYCYSQGMYYMPTLNCCSYNTYLSNGGRSAVASHAAAFVQAHAGLPNILGIDVAQEYTLMHDLATETHNSNGDPLNCPDPASKLSTDQDAADFAIQILQACQAVNSGIPLTASFAKDNFTSAMWTDTINRQMAQYCDYLDFHCYYDAAPGDSQIYGQTEYNGKPFLVSEFGQNMQAGTAAQVTRLNAVWNNVVNATYSGQPGCYGGAWWAGQPQGAVTNDDWGMWDASGTRRTVATSYSLLGAKPTFVQSVPSGLCP